MPSVEANAINAMLGLETTTRSLKKADGKPQIGQNGVLFQETNVVPGKNSKSLKINVFELTVVVRFTLPNPAIHDQTGCVASLNSKTFSILNPVGSYLLSNSMVRNFYFSCRIRPLYCY